MATRQYIGARYVLKVYTNSQDPSSAEWESGAVYEPLTMVTYQNSSYVSRSQVPASAGNPATATTYWAITGAYNGQIASLQNQIGTLSNLITPEKTSLVNAINGLKQEIDYKNTVFMYDSYGETGSPQTFATRLPYYLGLSSSDYINIVQGGAGFTSHATYQFQTILQSNATLVSAKFNPAAVKYVIVEGGANDHGESQANVETAVLAFCDYVKATYPNAQVIILFTGWMHDSSSAGYDPIVSPLAGYRVVTQRGGKLLDAHNAIHMYSLFSDHVHPNDTGSLNLVRECVNLLLGGSPDVHYKCTPTFTLDTDVWTNQYAFQLPVIQTIDNDICMVSLSQPGAYGGFISTSQDIFDSSHYGKVLHLGELSDYIIGDNNEKNVIMNCGAVLGGSGISDQQTTVQLMFRGKDVYLKCLGVGVSTEGTHVINALGLWSTSAVISSSRC